MFELFSILFKSKDKTDVAENSVDNEIEDIKRPTIIMIHGANATSRSFTYFKSQMPNWNIVTVDYNSNDGFYYNLERMIEQTKKLGPLFVVAHSLGGVYALHMIPHLDIKQVVTVSTPFAGSTIADWARYMIPSYQLFKDIGTKSQPIVQARDIEVTIPWTQVVTTQGAVPWVKGDNDGVVTIKSMNCRNDMENIYVNENHYEILASDFVIELIKQKYLNCRL